MKQRIQTDKAPQAIGPYSQAVELDGWIFCSGQVPLDPATGKIIEGDIPTQTQRVLDNLQGVLESAGATLADVVKTNVYLCDLNDFQAMNGAYAERFTGVAPARATVEVSRLPADARVEIDAIARKR